METIQERGLGSVDLILINPPATWLSYLPRISRRGIRIICKQPSQQMILLARLIEYIPLSAAMNKTQIKAILLSKHQRSITSSAW
jgi:hypothetical protein